MNLKKTLARWRMPHTYAARQWMRAVLRFDAAPTPRSRLYWRRQMRQAYALYRRERANNEISQINRNRPPFGH